MKKANSEKVKSGKQVVDIQEYRSESEVANFSKESIFD